MRSMAQFNMRIKPHQKHEGRGMIHPAPVDRELFPDSGGVGQQLEAVAVLGFKLVAVGRFLAFDAVLGPWYSI